MTEIISKQTKEGNSKAYFAKETKKIEGPVHKYEFSKNLDNLEGTSSRWNVKAWIRSLRSCLTGEIAMSWDLDMRRMGKKEREIVWYDWNRTETTGEAIKILAKSMKSLKKVRKVKIEGFEW